jgi:hypothetical protein
MTLSDAVLAPVWLALNLALGACLWNVARDLFPRDTPRQLAFHTVTLAWAVITLVSIALGSIGLLDRFGPMACVAGIAVALVARRVLRRPAGRLDHPVRAPSALLASMTRARNLAISLLALALIGHTLADGLTGFVRDWDSLMYHIPLVDQWIHARSLYAPDCFQWSNPGGNELIGFWIMAPFSGDFFGSLNNLPGTALLMLSLLELAPWFGLTPRYAQLAAAAAVANFVVFDQLTNAGNDVAVTALFLATLAYGTRFAGSGRGADMVLCGVTLGLLAGIKYFALGYAAVAWGVCSWLAVRRRGRPAGVRLAAASVLLAAVVGGYWYARNAVVSGSPFYPLGLTAGADPLSERYPHPWMSSLLGCGRTEAFAMWLRAVWRLMGPCYTAAVLGLPLILVWLVTSRARPGPLGFRDGRMALVMLLVGSIAVYLATPFCVEDKPQTLNQLWPGYTPTRYGLSPLVLAVVGLSVCLQDVAKQVGRPSAAGTASPWRRALSLAPPGLLGLGIVGQLGVPHANLHVDRIACTLFALNGLGIAFLLQAAGRRAQVTALALTALGTGLCTGWISARWQSGFYQEYERFFGTGVYARARDLGGGAKICVLDYICHPFFGPERRGRVCQPQQIPSPEWLFGYLESQGCDLLFVNSRLQDGPSKRDSFARVAAWLEAHEPRTQLLYRERDRLLYRVQGAHLPAVSSGPARPGRRAPGPAGASPVVESLHELLGAPPASLRPMELSHDYDIHVSPRCSRSHPPRDRPPHTFRRGGWMAPGGFLRSG